jgi:DNA-binding Lrp family transcriptional regulator
VQSSLAEADLALIHALQVAPRIGWAAAAPVLGTSPARLAERWERLRRGGLAWVTAYPALVSGVEATAWVEVDCRPGHRRTVVRRLCEDARVVTVEESALGRDLLVMVRAPELESLTSYILDELPVVDGVVAQRASLSTGVHFEGGGWHLDALDAGQVEALRMAGDAETGGVGEAPRTVPTECVPLMALLAADGRLSAAELARRTGRHPATVRRQLRRLLTSGVVALRCDVAQLHSRWPISCTWLARVPPHEVGRTVKAIATLPELRLCASTTGRTNLMITVWVRSLADVLRLEHLLGERLPWLDVVDTSINLRTAKRMGWLLDAEGRSTGRVVPFALPGEPQTADGPG